VEETAAFVELVVAVAAAVYLHQIISQHIQAVVVAVPDCMVV
jgi:hypothetical protein